MLFTVANECRELGLRAGAVVWRGLQVGPSPAELRSEIAAAVAAVRERFPDIQAARSTPALAASHDILRKVGVNPRREQNSVDRLLAFALKRGDLPAINSLVDAYNLVSLRTLCSLGAHDLDKIALPVQLQLLSGNEVFTPLGRDAPGKVRAGEFGYVDAQERLLCRLDVLQADFSKVTAATCNALLIVEGNTTHGSDALRQAMDQAVELISHNCGGTSQLVYSS